MMNKFALVNSLFCICTMNIFGVSRKRKLDKLSEDVSNLQSQIDDVKSNPLQLSSTKTPYFPGWYFVEGTVDTSTTTAQEGIAEVPTSADVRWGFTVADSVDVTKYDYVIQYKVYASNGKNQAYLGFSQKAVNLDSRVGSSYPTTGGWPMPSITNNFGEAVEFRLTPSLTAWGDHDPSTGYNYTTTNIDVSTASDAVPYEVKLTIAGGKVSSMEAWYNGSLLEDFVSTYDWVINLPEGPLHMYFVDTDNSYPYGNSNWKVGMSILQRTLRGGPYNLKNSIRPHPTHPTTLSTVGQRFIPYGHRVVELNGHSGHNHIPSDVYFLPTAKCVGELLFLINTSGGNLTVYDGVPDDPTIPTPTWPSYTLPYGAVQDPFAFVSISTAKWRQLV